MYGKAAELLATFLLDELSDAAENPYLSFHERQHYAATVVQFFAKAKALEKLRDFALQVAKASSY